MNKVAGSLDANAVLRLILNDIPVQGAAVAALLQDSQRVFVVVDLVFVEVEYALRTHYGFSRVQISDTLGELTALPSLRVDTRLMKRVFNLYLTHTSLSFTDCCLVAHAEEDAAQPLWTFDKKLAGQTGGTAQLIAA